MMPVGFNFSKLDFLKNVPRRYVWFGALTLTLVVLGAISWSRFSAGPFARPIPGSKWTQATQEPDLRVFVKETGAVRTMKFEDYIAGVVAAEMDPSWPLEALKSQAIVARTFTIEQLERKGGVAAAHPGADVSTDPQEFQAFDAGRVNDNVRRAVQETRGVIITYRGRPVRAWFHSDAGGQTATPVEGLGGQAEAGDFPYLRTVRVPWTSPNTEWSATFTRDEVRRAAMEAGQDPGSVASVSVGRKGPSGRAVDIVVGNATVPAPDFRLAIGSDRMRSTLITSLTMQGDKVVMTGRGNGHGVGLAQWAAKAMAEQGRTADDIVRFFYSRARLSKLWP